MVPSSTGLTDSVLPQIKEQHVLCGLCTQSLGQIDFCRPRSAHGQHHFRVGIHQRPDGFTHTSNHALSLNHYGHGCPSVPLPLCSRPLSITTFLCFYLTYLLSTKTFLAANTRIYTHLPQNSLTKHSGEKLLNQTIVRSESSSDVASYRSSNYTTEILSLGYCQIAILFLLAWKSCLSSQSC